MGTISFRYTKDNILALDMFQSQAHQGRAIPPPTGTDRMVPCQIPEPHTMIQSPQPWPIIQSVVPYPQLP